jgi:hypothetical protein
MGIALRAVFWFYAFNFVLPLKCSWWWQWAPGLVCTVVGTVNLWWCLLMGWHGSTLRLGKQLWMPVECLSSVRDLLSIRLPANELHYLNCYAFILAWNPSLCDLAFVKHLAALFPNTCKCECNAACFFLVETFSIFFHVWEVTSNTQSSVCPFQMHSVVALSLLTLLCATGFLHQCYLCFTK